MVVVVPIIVWCQVCHFCESLKAPGLCGVAESSDGDPWFDLLRRLNPLNHALMLKRSFAEAHFTLSMSLFNLITL
jgi:hypothetical protein